MTLKYIWAKFLLKIQNAAVRDSFISEQASISPKCNIINCKINRHSYLGVGTWAVNAEIGSFCSIADSVYIGGAMHPIKWASTSPVFQNVKHSSSELHYSKHDWNPYSEKVVIGNDVWIGHGVVIQQGVRIGNGAVIGSNAVVTKDVPPYAIVGGVPAKVIKYRFNESIIHRFQISKWWNLNDSLLEEAAQYIKDPAVFLRIVESFEKIQ